MEVTPFSFITKTDSFAHFLNASQKDSLASKKMHLLVDVCLFCKCINIIYDKIRNMIFSYGFWLGT